MKLKLAVICATLSFSLMGAIIPVISYSGPNGATGTYNYRDFTYLPCPGSNCTTTGAPLSGGTGKLTDGVSPVLDWDQQGTATSWVGWDTAQGLANPTITFFFGQTVTINSVTVWVSNSLSGGVGQPSAVVIGGSTQIVTPDSVNTTPRALTFSGLNITGSNLNIQFDQQAGFQWVMVGEVTFNGQATATPEPGTLAMFLLVLPTALVIRRRTRMSKQAKLRQSLDW